MSKPLLLRRNFSIFNRIPHAQIVRSAARDGHETVTIQRVRIRRPFLGKSRLVGAVAIGIATYGLGRYIGIEVEIEEVEEKDKKSAKEGSPADEDGWQKAGEEVEDEEEEEEEYDDAILFLPTGFSRPRRKTFYKGSDPEWQAFKKIATERPRVEKIRGELATLLRDMVAQSPPYKAVLGKIDTKKGKMWMEFKFPDGPPIEFERPGIELTEDLEWRKATRPVEDLHHHRLNRILVPTEVANALYQDTTKKAAKSWKGFKIYMGWDQGSKPDTVQRLVQEMDALVQRIDATTKSSSAATPSTPSNPLATSSAKDTEQSTSPPTAPVDGPAEKGFVLPDPKKMTLDLSQFRADFKKAFKPYPLQPPRGTFMVMGLVEVYGDKARMTLNVQAAYDPKQGRYVSMKSVIWNYVELRQHPKGGP